MSFSIETKFHILLIMTVIGIALYMYLLYKEVKLFQDDLVVLKRQVLEMQSVKKEPTVCISEKPEKAIEEQIEDDDESVSSNEIKDILSNIDNKEAEAEIEIEPDDEEILIITDIGSMTEEQLKLQKYDVLKEYLRANKMSYKGVRNDFITRILNKQKETEM